MSVCWRCAAEQADGLRFCTRCGARLETVSAPPVTGAFPPAAAPPPAPPVRPRRAWLPVASAVLIVIIGAAVGLVLYVHHNHSSPSAQARPATTPADRPTPTSSSPPSTGPTVVSDTPEPTTAAPSPTRTSGATGSGNSTVAVSTRAGQDPLSQPAVALLTRYFQAINARDFHRYRAVFAPDYRSNFTEAGFAGYASTYDRDARISSVTTSSDGRREVHVTFTSTQDAADSLDGETCTNWRVRYYLEPVGDTYLFGRPPVTYHAQHSAC